MTSHNRNRKNNKVTFWQLKIAVKARKVNVLINVNINMK